MYDAVDFHALRAHAIYFPGGKDTTKPWQGYVLTVFRLEANEVHDEPSCHAKQMLLCLIRSIREHAVMMGMLLPEDEELLWIAEESLLAPLPEGTP